ncbi:MAG: pitrilysin family protein [Erysipelotrichaceae bacterium]|nr:pitrilysin family protein [Erysipelotrichaceae bacterium]
MDKIYQEYYDETYYTETLDNGLKVTVIHKPEFNSTVCAFGTPYGALNINQKYNGKVYHFHPGIAHFLEHKLFEAHGDDIMNAFSSMGASVNAFTSYRETVYYFSKTGKDIKKPLNLLLDFVQDLNISEESVEKEKGIIFQEISMYGQMPDSRLLNETYASIYHKYPYKYDIGGDKESIYAITKEELEECYRINYHPSNMLLVVSTPEDPKKIIKIVRENQAKKDFRSRRIPKTCNDEEPDEVVHKTHRFHMNVNTDRHLLIYKFRPDFKSVNEAFTKEWCIRILMEAHFSSLNPQYQKWLDDKIINDYFGYEVEFDTDCANLMFYIENDDPKILKKLVRDTLKKDLLTQELLDQIKRRYIGTSFQVFNDIESFNNGYIRDSLSGLDFFEALKALQNISLDDIRKTYSELDFTHYSYISLLKNSKN